MLLLLNMTTDDTCLDLSPFVHRHVSSDVFDKAATCPFSKTFHFNQEYARSHENTGHITLNRGWKKRIVVTSAWSTNLWSSTTSLDFGLEGKTISQSVFILVSMTCWAVGVSRLCVDHQKWEKEQNSVLCISSLPFTPTQPTWSPTGRLDCDSSSTLLTIVLLFISLSLSSLFANSYSWEAHSHPKVSVGESCQRAQGLSKQGESSPFPHSRTHTPLSVSVCTPAQSNYHVWDHGQELELCYGRPGRVSLCGSDCLSVCS